MRNERYEVVMFNEGKRTVLHTGTVEECLSYTSEYVRKVGGYKNRNSYNEWTLNGSGRVWVNYCGENC